MIEIDETFSKVPNILLLPIEEGKSILNTVKNDKTILILHELYMCTNLRKTAVINIEYLIHKTGYFDNSINRKEFKDILLALKSIDLISFKDDDFKPKDFIEINTSKLIEVNKYCKLHDSEIKLIKDNTKEKEFTNLLKVYLYLKIRCYKRSEPTPIVKILSGDNPEITYCSYENISYYTNISEGKLKKYIDLLQEINLIKYKNLGLKYHESDKKKRTSDCSNIYALTYVSGLNNLDDELSFGLKQQKEVYKNNGYKIIRNGKYKNNNRQINGRKGYLIKQKNNGKITKEQLKELTNIIDINNK